MRFTDFICRSYRASIVVGSNAKYILKDEVLDSLKKDFALVKLLRNGTYEPNCVYIVLQLDHNNKLNFDSN